MEKNKINLVLVAVLSIFFLVGAVSATTATMVTPADSAVISGTATLNSTINEALTDGYVEASFFAKSSSTANSSWTFLGLFTNETLVSFNGTFDSTILEDSNDYIFNVTVGNATGNITATTTGVTVDNTIPETPSSLSPSTNTIDNDRSVTFSSTVTGSQTTGCTLIFDGINPGSSSYTMTHSGSSCTHTLTGLSDQTYNWYIRASDGTNTTDSSTLTVIEDFPDAKGVGKLVELSGGKTLSLSSVNGDIHWGWIVGVIVVIVLLIYFKNK